MKYNPGIHHRKSIRLKGYDYSNAALYFLTICTYNRESIFHDIVGAGSPCPALCPLPHLNRCGKINQQYWDNISNHFQNVVPDEFVIMPNHIHGIIKINPYTRQDGEAPPLLVKKKCLYCKYCERFSYFKTAVNECLENCESKYKNDICSLMTLKFQVLKNAS